MPTATSNRLLPILGGVVVLMFSFVTLKSCTGEEGNDVVLDSVPAAPAPDADTPADTIKTLTANVAAMTYEVQALRRDGQILRCVWLHKPRSPARRGTFAVKNCQRQTARAGRHSLTPHILTRTMVWVDAVSLSREAHRRCVNAFKLRTDATQVRAMPGAKSLSSCDCSG